MTKTMPKFALSLSLGLFLLLLARAFPAQGQSGRMEGIVVDSANGLPLADVKVQAKGPKSVSTTTNRDGRFTLEDLSTGIYQLITVSDRYSPLRGIWQTVEPGKQPLLTLALKPWGIASGVVLDSNGKPVTNALVMAYRRGYGTDGSPLLRLDPDRQISQPTNDRGEFRLFRLEPGEYCFRVETPGNGPPMTSRAPAFWPVYYPGTTDSEKAIAITIKAGEEVRLGPVTVPASSDSIVRLHIVNMTGEPLNVSSRTVTFRPGPNQTTNFTIVGANTSESDVIALHGLPPGHHEILVSWNASKGTVQGLASVEAGFSDSEAELRVRGGSLVTGIVRNDGSPGGSPIPGLRCLLQTGELMRSGVLQNLTGTSGQDGTFVIENVPQAEYRFQCSGLPAGSSIRGIRMNNSLGNPSELMDRFRVDGETHVSVVVATETTAIHGRVSGLDGKAVQGATVVLEPDSASPARNYLYRTAMTDQNGTFIITDVIAGSYRMFSWHELRDPAYMNDEFMKPYQKFARPVQVDPKGKEIVTSLTVLD